MEAKMKTQQITPNMPNLSCKLTTWITVFCFLMQSAVPAYAMTMSNSQIETDLASNYAFFRDTANSDYQYIASPYIDAVAPSGGMTFDGFVDDIIDQYDYAVGGPTYVPIGMDGITIFIPTYPSYKAVGDPLVQSRYVRAQIRAMLGRTLIDSTDTAQYGSEATQLNTLLQNAVNYVNTNPAVRVGDNLGFDQDGAPLAYPMVWPELRTIHGEQVLVPIVYLTSTEMAFEVTENTTIIGSGATFADLHIDGTTIQFGRDAFLQVINSLLVNGGEILGAGDLEIRVGGELKNLSGLILAQGDLTIAAKSIESGTIVHQYEIPGGQGGYFGEISSISSVDGSVVLRAYEDIVIAGTIVTAGQDIKFAADGSIYIGTSSVAIVNNYSDAWRTSQSSSVEYLGSVLSAGESIELIANGEIVIDASEIIADNGHIEILAGLGITIIDELNQSQSYSQGTFGNTSSEVSTYKTVAMRSLLDAGKDLTIHAQFGDITLKAVDISSGDGTNITASNGAINLLVTKETDHYSYSSVSENLFTITTVSRGHDAVAVVPNTIVGGFQADALYGLNIEYEGDPDYTFDQQLDALEAMPGLDWIVDARLEQNVNWTAVESKYDEWNVSNTSLTPAAIALISIAVAVATGGGAGIGEAIVGSAGTTSAAVGAASLSLITAATIASTNALLNGEDPFEAAFETLTDSEALVNAAIAAVTAGAIAALEAEFFDFGNATGETNFIVQTGVTETGAAVYGLSLTGQTVQAVGNAAITAGVRSIAYQDDLEDIFLDALFQDAVSQLSGHVASGIRDTWDGSSSLDTALRYIAHAGAGCVFGVAIDDGDSSPANACGSGAFGSVVGEFYGDIQTQQELDTLEQLQLDFLESNGISSTNDLLNITHSEYFEHNLGLPSFSLEEARALREQGVDIARLAAGIGAFISGGDVDTAAQTAATTGNFSSLRNLEQSVLTYNALNDYLRLEIVADFFHDIENSGMTQSEIANVLAAYSTQEGFEFISGLTDIEALNGMFLLLGHATGSSFSESAYSAEFIDTYDAAVDALVGEARFILSQAYSGSGIEQLVQIASSDPTITLSVGTVDALNALSAALSVGDIALADVYYQQLLAEISDPLTRDLLERSFSAVSETLQFGADTVVDTAEFAETSTLLAIAATEYFLYELTGNDEYRDGAAVALEAVVDLYDIVGNLDQIPGFVATEYTAEMSEISLLESQGNYSEATRKRVRLVLTVTTAIYGTAAAAKLAKGGVEKFRSNLNEIHVNSNDLASISKHEVGRSLSADTLNSAFLFADKRNYPPYMSGTFALERDLGIGAKIYVVVKAGDDSPGGWATTTQYTDMLTARNELSLLYEFKADGLSYVLREYTVTAPMPIREGIVGNLTSRLDPTDIRPGEGTQYQFMFDGSYWGDFMIESGTDIPL